MEKFTLEPDISVIAGLIGEPARARMLTALLSGKALTATELALEGDITAQTASSHLAKLVDGELLVVRKQGRHKYFQLQGSEVAELLERLLNISASANLSKATTGPVDKYMRSARVCYDHLAGELGVALYDALVTQQLLIEYKHEAKLTAQGQRFFTQLGVDFEQLGRSKRPLCKSCLDWSERRNHLAGQLGAWILQYAFDNQWAKRDLTTRAIHFTPSGRLKLAQCFGL